MDQRFSQESLKILGSFGVFQPSRFNMNLEDGLKHIERLCSFYDLDCSATKSQYQLLLKQQQPAQLHMRCYSCCEGQGFTRSIQICTNSIDWWLQSQWQQPHVNAHSVSCMALIKNQLRSTMGQKRLEGLMILWVESDITECFSFEDVIKRFSVMAPCRSNFGHVEHWSTCTVFFY